MAADGPADRGPAGHVLVADLDELALDPDDHRHLAGSLRLRVGEVVTATDGAGAWRACRWDGDGLEPADAVRTQPRPHPAVTIGFAPAKGDRPELVVRMLTELGVARIVPLVTDRGVVRWSGERAGRRVARLGRVAREALMQSRRVWLPEICPPTLYGDALDEPTAVVADRSGAAVPAGTRAVLVGPEGGWSEQERAQAPRLATLGDAVLRAETAAVVAATVLCGHSR